VTAAENGFFENTRAVLLEPDPEIRLRLLPSLAAQADAMSTQGVRRAVVDPGAPPAPAGGLSDEAALAVLALDLSLDCAARFRGLPCAYYRDWVACAIAVGRVYRGLSGRPVAGAVERLRETLWPLVMKTGHDVLVRMALAPRLLAANMDGYGSRHDLRPESRAAAAAGIRSGALRSGAGMLLGTGDRWFVYACGERGIEPGPCLARLLSTYTRGEQRERIHRLGLAGMVQREPAMPPRSA